ncbi:MAG: phenylalanine--tRNA ligase subunit beta [Oligoflexus sp.]
MRVSLNWLNDYISLQDLPIEQIAETLTSLGLEVEGIETLEPWTGEVLVGQIIEAKRHPDAEKLQVCQVDVGESAALTIVCGAANARQDLKVAVAKVGSTLPGDFKIKASKIRGEKSFGMLCSGKELAISEDADGIMELAEDLPIGTSLAEHFQLRDTVIEIGLTPNRTDCLGYIGIARDLAAKLKRPLKVPDAEENKREPSLLTESHIKVEIAQSEDCGRFIALYMDKIKVQPSPLWLQKRLENAGMRPINLIVDATNYVMLETGQPIHAYDLRDIQGGVIRVRRAKDKESLTTLDGSQRQLSGLDIVISDAEQAIGLAGVMGGENSEVKTDTTEIIIEVAHFNASLVRKTAKRHGIHSEASHRFERGTDIHQVESVAVRVASLIQDLSQEQAAGQEPLPRIAGKALETGAELPALPRIALRLPRVRQISGISTLTLQDCIDYMESLGCKYLDRTEERVVLEVPSWRLDIIREIDLIEEIVRLHGYEKIPYSLPMMEIGFLPENTLIEFIDQLKVSMAEIGFHEIISFPFIGPLDLEKFQIPQDHPYRQVVELANPLVEEQRFLRTSLSQSLLKALLENRRHGIVGSRIFECARNFYEFRSYECPTAYQELKGLFTYGAHLMGRGREEDRPLERNCIGGVLDQPYRLKTWQQAEIPANFYHGKAVVTKLLRSFGADDLSFSPINPALLPWMHPKTTALVKIAGEWAGYVGELHPHVADAFGLDFQSLPIFFELDVEPIWRQTNVKRDYLSAALRFPPVSRDIAIILSEHVTHADIEQSVSQFNRRKFLKDVRLFDVFRDPKLGTDKKSLAYSLTFQSPNKTLTDKEVEKELNALLDHLRESVSAELR